MIPLTKHEPAISADYLTDTIKEAFSQYLSLAESQTEITIDVLQTPGPVAEHFIIKLDGAQPLANVQALKFPKEPVDSRPAFEAQTFALSADPLRYQGAPISLKINASHILFEFVKATDDRWWLAPRTDHAGASGTVDISVTQANLSKLLCNAASEAAKPHGVSVEACQLQIRKTGNDAIDFTAELSCRKSFMKTKVAISGNFTLTPDLQARLQNVKLTADGLLGGIASTILQPFVKQLEGKTFSLSALPLGTLAINKLEITSIEPLSVHASFG